MRLRISLLRIFVLAAVTNPPGFARQQYVNRYDLFTAYSHLSSPSVSLQQTGFNTSFGFNVTRWVAVGADVSIFKGDGSIELGKTNVAPLLPPLLVGLNPAIPFSATTYTFAAGPQFNLRTFNRVTLFGRPGLGALHESATLHVPPALAPLASLVPGLAPNLTDTVVFYGAGGGFDYNLSRHVAVRFSVDFVHTHLFSNFLSPRNAVRFSIGPTWRWGELK